jgi:hypothetical protein
MMSHLINGDTCYLFYLFVYFMDEALLSRVIRCKTLSAQCSLGTSGAEPQLPKNNYLQYYNILQSLLCQPYFFLFSAQRVQLIIIWFGSFFNSDGFNFCLRRYYFI